MLHAVIMFVTENKIVRSVIFINHTNIIVIIIIVYRIHKNQIHVYMKYLLK